ncbi:MAG: hypothetical protein ACI3ZF_04120 [Candidatus Cryptobacteroides sp.]
MLGAFSCTEPAAEPQTEKSVLSVESNLLSIGYEEGQHHIYYSVKGPEVEIEASCEQNWVEIKEVTEDCIALHVTENDEAEDRFATLSIWSSSSNKVTVHLAQSKKNESQAVYHDFGFEVQNISTCDAAISISPLDPSRSYYCNILTKAQYESIGAGKIVDTMVEGILQLASIYGVDPSGMLYRGVFETQAAGIELNLLDNTVYYVIAFYLEFDENSNAKIGDRMEVYEFRTKSASQNGMSFELSFEDGFLKVSPDASYTYICDITTKEIWEDEESPEDLARQYISVLRSYGVLNNYIIRGEQVLQFDDVNEENSNEYVAYAVGYRDDRSDRGLTTKVFYKYFSIK